MAATELTDDERRLAELGYKQDLDRRMSGFANFAMSFTIISILSGALTLYGTGINYGGPAQQAWVDTGNIGWVTRRTEEAVIFPGTNCLARIA